jgi:hypothetical protein
MIQVEELAENKTNNLKFTHSFWLYIKKLPQNDNNIILKHDLGSSTFTVELDKDSTLRVISDLVENSSLTITNENILLQKWNHIAIVQDVNTMDLYIDGILVQTVEIILNNIVDRSGLKESSILIGSNADDPAEGWVLDQTTLAYYKYYANALTQGDIKSIYNNYAEFFKKNSGVITLELDVIQNSNNLGSIVF